VTTNQPNPRPPCPDAADSVTCEHCVEFLLEYIDGVLPDAEKFKFESHIALCRDCEIYLANYRAAASLAAGLGRDPRVPVNADVPPGLVDAILRARKHNH
jgi:anti-sigma factor RsiW